MKLYRVQNEIEIVYGVVIANSLEEAKMKWQGKIKERYGNLFYRYDEDEYTLWIKDDETNGVLLFD